MKTILLAMILVAVPLGVTQSSGPPSTPSACSSPENRQFDFWVGRWEVFAKAAPDKKVADSLIERLYSGCAIRENWMPLAGDSGGSLNQYRQSEGIWRQIWLDSTGSWVEFQGRWNGKTMVLEGVWPQPGHPKQRTRMTYSPLPNGDVEQAGEVSDDDGRSWQPSFDFIYRTKTSPKLVR
jgi:hypothetical protein